MARAERRPVTVRATLFRWRPGRDTLVAFAAGIAVVVLSLAMLPLDPRGWANIAVRDLGQVYLVGFLFPLLYIRRMGGDFADFGFSLRRWPLFLVINVVLAIGLFFLMRRGTPPPADFRWTADVVWKAAYVLVAVTFECLFFYGFLRTLFERAFGAVVGVVLAAAFYAFHHAGFQPEFAKLFFVGVLYATVFRLGNSALLIWPFFIGVGGVYDVLVSSKVVAPIEHPELRTIALAILMIATAITAARSMTPLSSRA
jgi:membrane protease YdiL (CAAX protease family)